VEWLTSVTCSAPASTESGGLEATTSATKGAECSARLLSFQRRASRKPRAWGASGLKKRLPSKCEMEISRRRNRVANVRNHWANLSFTIKHGRQPGSFT
jgi:hypothetical protein